MAEVNKMVPHDCYIVTSSEFLSAGASGNEIEKSEMKNQERNRERKFSRGGSSSGKGLESFKWTRYMVQLQKVGDKDLPCTGFR